MNRRYKKLIVSLLTTLVVVSACRNEHPAASIAGLGVPEGFSVRRAVPEGMVKYPMFATLDSAGRLFVIESSGKTTSTEDVLENPTFMIRLLEDRDGDGVYEKATVFADRIPFPMGGTFYRGSFYSAAPPDLLRFTDTDADGVADKREVILTGWTLNHNAATLSGPFFGPDGWMYMCDARRGFDIMTKEGTRLSGRSARIWRCRPDGTGLESVSGGGFDNTIELVFMPSGETIGTMTYFTDPQDGFRDALMHWVEGGVYPKPFSVIAADNLKQTGELMPVMTKLARVSHAGLMRYRDRAFGEEYEGNLFTAEFNTGRIMRYKMFPDGGTFRTEAEAFMTSEIPDFHPTDVLEDADGSMLVVNTGGWFIAGCPLSVVAKTDVHGGIFRITKDEAPPIRDAWGKQTDYRAIETERLVLMTGDPRHAVRDNAFEQLIIRGVSAVPLLKDMLTTAGHAETRASAVFALYRIGTPPAMDAVIAALDDESSLVRTAATRAVGLAKEKRAVDKLLSIIDSDEPQVRRQAATALGQIGDERAIVPLLGAAGKSDDRFVDHAIIYSLISLTKREPLVEALEDKSEKIQAAALIALDQMDESSLTSEQLKPFLERKNQRLRATSLWVLSHHPDWSQLALSFIDHYFAAGEIAESDKKVVKDLLTRFSHDRSVQRWMAQHVSSRGVTVGNKALLLEAMAGVRGKDFPTEWVHAIRRLLRDRDPVIRSLALDLAGMRTMSGFDEELTDIAADTKTPPAFRLKALSARILSRPHLSVAEFRMLLDFLRPENASTTRQAAVRLLGQAQLSDAQLVALGKDQIPDCDIYLLAGLVSAFEGSTSADAGRALISALDVAPMDRLDNLSLTDLEKILEKFPEDVQSSATSLMTKLQERQSERLAALQALEAGLTQGDVATGRDLFYGKALCSTCHSVAGNGGKFAPDLTNIGEIRSRHDILEAIIYPSASFAREYETSRVVTRTASYTGIIKDQLPETIRIESGPGVTSMIAVKDVTGIEPQNVSLMPAGLHKQLSQAELSDLMAYLTSLPDGLGQLRSEKSR